ncbi:MULTISPECIES: SCO family protein [unclassified Chelatococcus]|uniref:SCO family protein n=1 Tax=unclassified Chelatococcus TaxID=2638111 RepID=UPI001BCAC1B1|nr:MULTISPECIES: SCO family protein [unclassified Chelatococcus]MBS7701512.1 SCO family protein [Chelatococcus sp. YT9]MBX3556877.1 SCO family protein [Chelatococcus sp.]
MKLTWRWIGVIATTGALAAVLATAIALLSASRHPPQAETAAGPGGPFQLITQSGAELSNEDLKGAPFAIFFGFTHCPEVCPTTLWELSETLKRMGPDADKLKTIFVSLDPARDTPEMLKTYLQSFDPRIIGLTGNEDDITAVAKAYKVFWRKVPTESGDYTLDHTAIVYLMNGSGEYVGALAYHEDADKALAKMQRLVAGKTP